MTGDYKGAVSPRGVEQKIKSIIYSRLDGKDRRATCPDVRNPPFLEAGSAGFKNFALWDENEETNFVKCLVKIVRWVGGDSHQVVSHSKDVGEFEAMRISAERQ